MVRTLAAAAPLILAAWLLPAAAYAQQSTDKGCAWLVEPTADRENILYPEITTRYLAALIPALPGGGYVEISGQYPHARYMSLQTYSTTLQSIGNLHDTQIQPDAGSANPFLPGADRTAAARSYTVRVLFEQAPASNVPDNTLYYVGADAAHAGATLVYRIYLPDSGLQPFGGVPAPTLTEVLPGGARLAIPTCPDPVPDTTFLTQELAAAGLSDYPLPTTGLFGQPVPAWHKYQNAAASEVEVLTDNQILGALTPSLAALAAQLPAGFGENADNKYVYSLVSHDYGNVVMFRARLPATPKTYDGEATMGTGQMRFWSMCTGDLATQAYDCVVDKDMPLDGNGMYTLAVSTAADRPANARSDCGIAWLPWGPLVQAGVIMRNMLPDASFPNSVQAATPGTEQQTLGAYYPVGTYYASARDFEKAVGCQAPAVAGSQETAAGGGSESGGGAFDPAGLIAFAGLAWLRRLRPGRAV
jgi:hypothetical protein